MLISMLRIWIELAAFATVPSSTLASSAPMIEPATAQPSSARVEERWLEVIEVYTLPCDPRWRRTAEAAYSSNSREYFPKAYRRLVVSEKSAEERGRKLAQLSEDLQSTANKPMPLIVMRAWDGIEQREVVLSFGKGQRATANRFKPGTPLLASIGTATPGEDFQSSRRTVREIRSSANAPSDFASANDAAGALFEIAFGEVDSKALVSAVVVDAEKDPTPRSGVVTLALSAPPRDLQIDTRYPWFAEFKLFERAKDGTRAGEVLFTGTNALVAADGKGASGRVEVKTPQPWGYEAEVVTWFGVAPKASLKMSSKKGAAGNGTIAPPVANPSSTPLDEEKPMDFPTAPALPPLPPPRFDAPKLPNAVPSSPAAPAPPRPREQFIGGARRLVPIG